MRSRFRTFRALAALTNALRLHGVNAAVVGASLYYFDASIANPFGTRTLPMVLVVPVLVVLMAGAALPTNDPAILRQTSAVSSGRMAMTRLSVSLSVFAVGCGALVAQTRLPTTCGALLTIYAGAVLSATVFGFWYWVPVAMVFVALLPWLLTDTGLTWALQAFASPWAVPIGVVSFCAAGALYVLADRSLAGVRTVRRTG